jgi:hypothetical protein
LPNYANGGYAAALAIRFFAEIMGRIDRAGVTWSAGQKMKLSPTEEIEADFVLWYQRKRILANDYPTELVFGEAKSFRGRGAQERHSIRDAFEVDDIERLKTLACRFPGSILVFTTMKQASELSKQEISRLVKVAQWGREYVRDRRQTRAPVIVLTGNELFSAHALQQTWEKIGGRHAEFATIGWLRLEDLRVLADVTQQLYLGMPSYSAWFQGKAKARQARRGLKRSASMGASST